MYRQAFLIIAHNEFDALQRLLDALDDVHNDIYVHIDARVKSLPILKCKHSPLVIIENRMKIIWGHVSLLECEIRLMQEAMNKGCHYNFYHIISGTHYPLVSREEFNSFYHPYIGKSVLQPLPTSEEERLMRFGRYHYFMTYFISGNWIINKIYRFLWQVCLYLQKKMNIIRDYSFATEKASNWCSLSDDAIKIILSEKKLLLKQFSRTFCSDEYFVPSVLERHSLPIIYTDKLLFQSWIHSNPKVLTEEDYQNILASGCMFGRKFTTQSMSLIKKLQDGKN